jgi:hypothetical protein
MVAKIKNRQLIKFLDFGLEMSRLGLNSLWTSVSTMINETELITKNCHVHSRLILNQDQVSTSKKLLPVSDFGLDMLIPELISINRYHVFENRDPQAYFKVISFSYFLLEETKPKSARLF